MKKTARIALLIYLITYVFGVNGQTLSKEQFKDPSIEYWPRPLWFWNATVTGNGIASQMQAFRDKCGYGGVGILPFQDKFHPEYLSEEYFEVYKKALETAKHLGMTMCLYDEFGFPSGSAGAGHGDGIPRFQQLYPDETIGQLNKIEKEINGSALYETDIPEGKPMGVVAMETNSLKRIDITGQVADIAILYPIHTLQGDHFFDGPKGPSNEWFKGDVAVTKIDYDDVSNWITNYAGKDFTFIHPEVLDEKCSVIDGLLHLENKINWEEYRILVIPSCKTISVNNLQKIKDFYEGGGSIVFTTRLPSIAVESGKNEDVVNLIRSIFPNKESSQGIIYTSKKGGKALYISEPSAKNLRESLTEICSDFDVNYPVNEDIRYIHKVIEGQDVFYFANTGSESANLPVSLRGNLKLQRWDPHTGNITNIKINNNFDSKTLKKSTIANLSLKPFQSCFWVGEVVNN